MPQLIRPRTVNTTTQNGEVTIRLVIELHLNANGQITAASSGSPVDEEPGVPALKTDDKVEWEVPEFAPMETIEFGKYEK